MLKLKQWINMLDDDKRIARYIDRIYLFAVGLFYFWAFLYLFVWSR